MTFDAFTGEKKGRNGDRKKITGKHFELTSQNLWKKYLTLKVSVDC